MYMMCIYGYMYMHAYITLFIYQLYLLWDFEFEHWMVICSYRYLSQSYNTM